METFRLMFVKRVIVYVVLVLVTAGSVLSQCPWSKNVTDLHAACSCSFVVSKLTVRCTAVNVTKLLSTLRELTGPPPLDLLEVSNSSVPILADDAFYNLRVSTVQFGSCGLRHISANALRDLDGSLLTLNLPRNELTDAALTSLRKLSTLTSLDLSENRITVLRDDAFRGISLDTLNLMANNLTTMAVQAFQGLELTLKNLNLKNTGQVAVPACLRNLTALAFLDLAENAITDLGSGFFERMDSLTALSLERNQLTNLSSDAFVGLEDTMSSLSLLSNQFTTVPIGAISILKELRVLDLGFNRISEVPSDAFLATNSLNLLALDGNHLSTLPFSAFRHLNRTLRGLSVGGRSLVCDCHIRWIVEWIREYDLKVTSRERNPQFCGHPAAQRNRNLYLLRPSQLTCPDPVTTTTTTVNNTTTVTVPTSTVELTTQNLTTTTISTTMATPSSITVRSVFLTGTKNPDSTSTEQSTTLVGTTTPTLPASSSSPHLVHKQRSARKNVDQDIRIVKAFRDKSTILLTWEALTSNVPGFRVIYRVFGETVFKKGTDLPLDVQKFRMTGVPPNECVVVCVVSAAIQGNLTVDTVPAVYCRELRSGDESHVAGYLDVDKIVIIAAAAAICSAVIIAVIIFVCCQRQSANEKRVSPLPIVELPTLEPSNPEWDNASAYSSRSIPRARMYHLGGTVNSAFLPDDARSHFLHPSAASLGNKAERAHSMIDGQYGAYMNGNTHEHFPLGRPDTNRSSKSLAAPPASYLGTNRKKKLLKNGGGKWNGGGGGYASMQSMNGYNANNAYFHSNPWSGSEIESYPSGGNHVRELPFNKRDYT